MTTPQDGQHDSGRTPGSHSWNEEDLLQWVLDERLRAATPRAELDRDAQTAAALSELEGFVAECRASLADERVACDSTEDSTQLADEVLALTTREDLGLRGDLRLVGGFLKQSLNTSMLLRVVAASLLLHVAALPVLAYFTFFQPKAEDTRVTWDLGRHDALPYTSADDVEPEPIVKSPEFDLDPAALPAAGELFASRLAEQNATNPGGHPKPAYETVVWNDELGLVLWTEHKLDAARSGDPTAERLLRFALENLSQSLADGGGEGALRQLEESAWMRAERAGFTQQLAPEFGVDATRLEHARELRGDAWGEVYLEAAREDS